MGYEAQLNRILNTNIKINNEKICKVIINHVEYLIDYISIDVYKHVKNIIYALGVVDILSVIEFKNRNGYKTLNKVISQKKLYLLTNNIKLNLYKYWKKCDIIHLLYSSQQLLVYCDNHNVNKFIKLLGDNINKITPYNICDLFLMFLIIHRKKFDGFNQWGVGNHATTKINVQKHYEKHILSKRENWESYNIYNAKDYEMFAINTSKIIKNRMVHTNGKNVYLSGFYKNILIIGRLGNERQIAISSCYIVYDELWDKKLENFRNNLCFTF